MAAADVLAPGANTEPFIRSVAITTTLMKPASPDFAFGDEKATASRFLLNNQSFVNLQRYLRAASVLPGSPTAFDRDFPPTLFKQWFDKDTAGGLLEKTCATFVAISSHCSNFEVNTITKMMTFTEKLLSFQETQDNRLKTILGYQSLISQENPDPSTLQNALAAVWSACKGLIGDAGAAEKEANDLLLDIKQFKDDTTKDSIALQDVQSRTSRILPTIDDIGQSQASKYNAIRDQLKHEFDMQVDIHHKNGSLNSGSLVYINTLGVVMYCRDKKQYEEYKKIDEELRKLQSDVQGTYKNGIQLNARTGNMKDMIKGVLSTITEAIDALKTISADFAAFKGGLDDIKIRIETMESGTKAPQEFLRKAAYNELKDARIRWLDVKTAAGYYKTHGTLLKDTDDGSLPPVFAPPMPATEAVELLGATFSGIPITNVAQALYSRGSRIEVPGVIRDFSDPEVDVWKSYTMLYKARQEYRVFCCREYDERPDYVYTFRNDFDKSSIGKAAVHSRVTPLKGPDDCPVEILAILWGPAKRDDQKIVDYVYSCVNNNPGIIWNDDHFGGDSWPNANIPHHKTGVIYYRYKGQNNLDNIHVLVARENMVTQFNA